MSHATMSRDLDGCDGVDHGLETMVDAPLLSRLLGLPVQARRLRHKPGLSTVAALVSRGPGAREEIVAEGPDQLVGWVQIGSEQHRAKRDKARRRAEEAGHVLIEERLADGWWLMAGTIESDPQLVRGLRSLAARVGPLSAGVRAGEVQVLRYNPNRRLVLRYRGGSADQVFKVTASSEASTGPLVRALAQAGVPVVRPAGAARAGRVTRWPWSGLSLDRLEGPAPLRRGAATSAGAALAALHDTPLQADMLLGPAWHPAQEMVRLGRLVGDIRRLDAGLGHAAEQLAVAVLAGLDDPDEPAVICHGDFSADQAVFTPQGDVMLLDFDRAEVAPPASDLGTFAAVELLACPHAGEDRGADVDDDGLTAPLNSGYERHRRLPQGLEPWIARALLLRSMEPLRSGQVDWRDGIRARLAQVREVIA